MYIIITFNRVYNTTNTLRGDLVSRGIIIFRELGTGKTTVGAELAQPLNFQHFDLDDFHL